MTTKGILKFGLGFILIFTMHSCGEQSKTSDNQTKTTVTAKDILGNPNYQAISYGGYRQNSRDIQPSVEDLKEDMLILSAMGIRVLRTYNTKLAHASNVIRAIDELKQADSSFEMYVMLGAWIDCKDAWTSNPDHSAANVEENTAEIERAVALANEFPDIVKVIAVGNEAMVKWATSYFVQANVILKWVNHLQDLKASGALPSDLWITSSDNFASWGGGDKEYHTEDLEELIRAVDYLSIHTYPMHDTHYNADFWNSAIENSSQEELIDNMMQASLDYSIGQYNSVKDYISGLGIEKDIHIGETGWASFSNGHYGPDGSKATDEYKEALFYNLMREWSNKNGISCFYFEAFDETWKDSANPGGSENHFGLFTIDGKAKYVIWDMVDDGVFDGLSRGGKSIEKTFNGNENELKASVLIPKGMEEFEISLP